MFRFSDMLLLLFLFTALYDCSPNNQKQLRKVGVGQARITGQIINVEAVNASGQQSGPCSAHPCIARVRIKSAQYGAGFPALSIGKDVRIKFIFTLSPTGPKMFPRMKERYPGLKKGDTFTAMVSIVQSIDQSIPKFQTYGYTKIELPKDRRIL